MVGFRMSTRRYSVDIKDRHRLLLAGSTMAPRRSLHVKSISCSCTCHVDTSPEYDPGCLSWFGDSDYIFSGQQTECTHGADHKFGFYKRVLMARLALGF